MDLRHGHSWTVITTATIGCLNVTPLLWPVHTTRVHGPCLRAVSTATRPVGTSVIFDTRVHGCRFWHPCPRAVFTARAHRRHLGRRVHGPWTSRGHGPWTRVRVYRTLRRLLARSLSYRHGSDSLYMLHIRIADMDQNRTESAQLRSDRPSYK